jgi:hypothetical protein
LLLLPWIRCVCFCLYSPFQAGVTCIFLFFPACGRTFPVITSIGDQSQPCPLDPVNRQFHAERPNALWVSDFTYVSTWQGFVYVAFVIDVYARRIVGWKASSSMRTEPPRVSWRLFGLSQATV